MKPKKIIAILLAFVLMLPFGSVAKAESSCDIKSVSLIAGQNIEVGNVFVYNDMENIYVEYVINNDGWMFTQLHLSVKENVSDIPQNKNNNPIPGQFEYKESFTYEENITSYVFSVPIPEGIESGDKLVIAAHAVVEKLGDDGSVIKTETSWGEGTRFTSKGNWGMYFEYEVCFNDNGNEEVECETDTAFGGNSKGSGNAWWYYFETKQSEPKTETIWAGQYKNAGNVTVTPMADDLVKITIEFNDGWSLQDVNEPVKIQGYDNVPDSRPVAGRFSTYKGNSLEVVVAYSDYYAIHLDVQYCQPK